MPRMRCVRVCVSTLCLHTETLLSHSRVSSSFPVILLHTSSPVSSGLQLVGNNKQTSNETHLFNMTPHASWEHLGQANDEQDKATWKGGVMAKASVAFSQLEGY